jgi:hypothetical protein
LYQEPTTTCITSFGMMDDQSNTLKSSLLGVHQGPSKW